MTSAATQRREAFTAGSNATAEQAVRLAAVVARTGLDPWDAHTAAIADVAACPILTLQASTWCLPSAALDEPLHVIEIAGPSDQGPEP